MVDYGRAGRAGSAGSAGRTSMSVVAYGSTMVVRPYYSSAMVVRHLLW